MVPLSSGMQKDPSSVGEANGRSVYHASQHEASDLCFCSCQSHDSEKGCLSTCLRSPRRVHLPSFHPDPKNSQLSDDIFSIRMTLMAHSDLSRRTSTSLRSFRAAVFVSVSLCPRYPKPSCLEVIQHVLWEKGFPQTAQMLSLSLKILIPGVPGKVADLLWLESAKGISLVCHYSVSSRLICPPLSRQASYVAPWLKVTNE